MMFFSLLLFSSFRDVYLIYQNVAALVFQTRHTPCTDLGVSYPPSFSLRHPTPPTLENLGLLAVVFQVQVLARGRSVQLLPKRPGAPHSVGGVGAICPGWFGSVRFGSVRFGSVRFGSVRFGSVRFGSVRFGSDRIGSVRFGLVDEGCNGVVMDAMDANVL